ncbi:unnamed protein product [Fraxinus pennsylvanica]|uniref:Uncharacterized protein n=1 Tax=Fraxinus pennsylvanica TaxID=56036 RepID=A0AAD1YU03_9LAMI|nr:unnamed protein product [Fraxinus pennsylvanica]
MGIATVLGFCSVDRAVDFNCFGVLVADSWPLTKTWNLSPPLPALSSSGPGTRGCLVEPNPVYEAWRKLLYLVAIGCRGLDRGTDELKIMESDGNRVKEELLN